MFITIVHDITVIFIIVHDTIVFIIILHAIIVWSLACMHMLMILFFHVLFFVEYFLSQGGGM